MYKLLSFKSLIALGTHLTNLSFSRKGCTMLFYEANGDCVDLWKGGIGDGPYL